MHGRRAVDRLLAAAALGLFSLGCESHPGKVPESATVLPIIGGNLAKTCVWPTAIMLVGPEGCSGALVHPRVVVTAKHCLVNDSGYLTPPASIGLGETRDQWAKTVAVSGCYTHPDNDFGICVLAKEVTDIPIVPVMAPCEASELAAGKAIVEVGFGVTSATGQTSGTKKWINGTIESAAPGQVDFDVTTGNQDGEYYGDSGGPLFFQMRDGTWRVIGEDCCSPNFIADSAAPRVSTYESVPYHVAWAEEVSGIDLTPCHDANGWNPTVACTGFPINPGDGVGTWSTMCQGGTLLRRQTCRATLPDAGTDGTRGLLEAGADTGDQDGPRDGPVNTNPGDSDSGNSGLDGDGDTGWAASDDGWAEIKDGGGMGGRAGSDEAGSDAPNNGPDSSADSDSGASAGAAGSNADGSDDRKDGGGDNGDTASAATDGSSEATGSDGTTEGSRTSGWDGGSGSDAASDQGGSADSISDGGVDQKATRTSGGGCACRGVPGRDPGTWPGLLGLFLVATRLTRRHVMKLALSPQRAQRSDGKKGFGPDGSPPFPALRSGSVTSVASVVKKLATVRARLWGRFVV